MQTEMINNYGSVPYPERHTHHSHYSLSPAFAPHQGEEIAEVIKRNPGTVRNQMQALKAIGLVDGIPGPKGGYNPTASAYKALNLGITAGEYDVRISRDGEEMKGVKVREIAFTTLCHPDVCQAMVKIIGTVKAFEIGDRITIGRHLSINS